MKKINNEFLKRFYESFSFIMPKSFAEKEYWVHSRFGNWCLTDSYKYSKNLQTMLSVLKQLVNENKKKKNKTTNKLLFILDEDVYFFFKDFIAENDHFFTDNVKNALDFLQRSPYSNSVVSIVYIGNSNDISVKLLNQLHYPVFFFTTIAKNSYDYNSYNALTFHSSLLFLKLLLKEILKK